MKRVLTLMFVLALLTSLPAFAETFDGILMDNMCSGMVAKKGYDAAKMHTKECALMENCVKSGFAVVTPDGKVHKLDDKGNKLALEALKGTDKKDNLTVHVEGKHAGETIAVTSLKLT